MIYVTQGNRLSISKLGLTDNVVKYIKNDLERKNPAYFWALRKYGRVSPAIPQHFKFYDETDTAITMPRNYLKRLLSLFLTQDIEYQLGAALREFTEVKYISEPLPVREYQARAVKIAADSKQCILSAGCGSGKTTLAVELIRQLQYRTLIVVHTKDLLKQWQATIKNYLKVESGTIGDGQATLGKEVTVALAQSLYKKPKLVEELQDCGLVIVDECHLGHYKTAEMFNSEYRIGLSATPSRSDSGKEVLEWTFGKIHEFIDNEELVEQGFRIKPYYSYINTGFAFESGQDVNYTKLLQVLREDTDRNRLIVNKVTEAVREGRKCLILSNNMWHTQYLWEMLKETVPEAEMLNSKAQSYKRHRVLEALTEGSIPALIATSLADVGLDVPILDTLFLVYPSKSVNLLEQRIGRVMRVHPDKNDAIIYDFRDSLVPTLERQAKVRERTLKKFCVKLPL